MIDDHDLALPVKATRKQERSRVEADTALTDATSQMDVEDCNNSTSKLDNLNQIFYEVENISNTIEVILRGKIHTIDVPKFLTGLDQIYDYFHERCKADFKEVNGTNKNKYLEIGVKLQNKIRNLNANNLQYLEIRTVIRAICCWIFLFFGELNPKSYLIILKVLAKCGYDFHHHLAESSSSELFNTKEKMIYRALVCYDTQLKLFEGADDLQVYHRLPPLEIQEIRMAVFRSIVSSMKILFDLGGHPDWIENEEVGRKERLMSELHRLMQLARTLVPSLHLRYRICLVELLFEITRENLSHEQGVAHEAISYYTSALDILEIPNDRIHESEDREEEASLNRRKLDLESRAYLGLSFIHAENNETSKARACLEAVERNSLLADDMKTALRLAKLTIFLKEDHLEYAESCLKDYVQDVTVSYTEAKAAVRRWLDHFLFRANTTPDIGAKITEVFKVFASRFPSDPEFSNIRILHLQAMVQFSSSDQEKYALKIFETANRIVTDHSHAIHVLTEENYSLFKNLLFDQLKVHYDAQIWNGVKHWSELMLKLIQNDSDLMVNVYAIKVEALINLQNYSEALDCAQAALTNEVSTRPLICLFKCLIYFENFSAENVLQRFSAAQEKMKVNSANFNQTLEEQFDQLSLCCSICHEAEIASYRKNRILCLLLRHWIGLYRDNRAWTWQETKKTPNDQNNTPNDGMTDESLTFLKVSCHYITYYINEFTFLENDDASSLLSDFLRFFEEDASNLVTSDLENKLLTKKYASKRVYSGNDSGFISGDAFVLNHLRSLEVVARTIENILDEVLKSYPLEVLGEERELHWLGNALQSIGMKLLEYEKRSTVNGRVIGGDLRQRRELLLLGSAYMAISEHIFSFFISFNATSLKERVKLLLLSSAALLDYCETISSNSASAGSTGSQSELSLLAFTSMSDQKEYLEAGQKARLAAERAAALLQMHFDFADEEDKKLISTALILQFGCFDAIGDREQSESFINGKMSEIQSMGMEDMREIIDIVENSLQFSMEALRMLLQCGIRAISTNLKKVSTSQNNTLLDWMYCKAIEISPSRKQALEMLHDFEQYFKAAMKTSSTSDESMSQIIEISTLDKIIAMSYNYSVTLIDLDQISLAEQFLLKAMTLVNYGSPQAQEWRSKMQESQLHIDKLKHRDIVTKAQVVSSAANKGKTDESKIGSDQLKSPELGKLSLNMDHFSTS